MSPATLHCDTETCLQHKMTGLQLVVKSLTVKLKIDEEEHPDNGEQHVQWLITWVQRSTIRWETFAKHRLLWLQMTIMVSC